MRTIPVVLAALLVCAAVAVGAMPVVDAGPGGRSTAVDDGRVSESIADRTQALNRAPTGDEKATTADAERPNADAETQIADEVSVAADNESVALRVLSLNETKAVAADIDVVTVDVGTATAFGANASTARVETISLRKRVVNANTSDERQKRILDGMNEVDKDVITLHSRQQAAIAAYAAGDMTATELLVELARIRAAADVLEQRVRLLDRLAEGTEDFALDDARVFPLVYDLQTFDGPVRSQTAAALNGDPSASSRVYVAATEDSVVLSTVVGDRYVRETFRGDLRSRDETGIGEETAQNATKRSYPEVYDATGGSISGQGSGGTFLFDLRYPNGTLTAFVTGGSERVFMEHHRIDLAGIRTGEAVTRTLDLTLTVNRTFPGGPLRVAVTDPETGEPVDAIVKVGREGGESIEIGTTGGDGVLWTVSPRGEFVVTVVEVGSTDVSTVSVTPTDPATVAEAYETANGTVSADRGT